MCRSLLVSMIAALTLGMPPAHSNGGEWELEAVRGQIVTATLVGDGVIATLSAASGFSVSASSALDPEIIETSAACVTVVGPEATISGCGPVEVSIDLALDTASVTGTIEGMQIEVSVLGAGLYRQGSDSEIGASLLPDPFGDYTPQVGVRVSGFPFIERDGTPSGTIHSDVGDAFTGDTAIFRQGPKVSVSYFHERHPLLPEMFGQGGASRTR